MRGVPDPGAGEAGISGVSNLDTGSRKRKTMGKVKPVKNGKPAYQPEFVAPYVEQLRQITCVKCGKLFHYRGSEDDEAIELGCGICSECQRMLSGGPHDGKASGDLQHEN